MTTAEKLIAPLVVLAVGVAWLLLVAFVVMLLVGVWHGDNPAVPALGFNDCAYGVSLVALLRALVPSYKRA